MIYSALTIRGAEQTHAYHHQEVVGSDTTIARTILLDGAKNFKLAAGIYGKGQDGVGAGARTDF
jgi:hypothetical protein